MKLTKLFIFCVSSLLFSIYGNAQDITVKGKVVDEKGMSVPGASVLIQGTRNGTSTGFDGEYVIKAQPNDVLVVSFIGYKTKTIAVNGQSTINVNLAPETSLLNEVVVVGYGTQKRSLVSGTISSIKAKAISGNPNSAIGQVLQGRVSGVSVTADSGQPGSLSTIRVRGVTTFNSGQNGNNPLWVVDGVIVDNGGIGFVNQSDIESVEVLKDAGSLAVYGARASAGVILITTKKGSKGKMTVSYNGFTGIFSPAKKLNLLDATQYGTIANEKSISAGGSAVFPLVLDPITKISSVNYLGKGTDWQAQIFNNAALTTNHEISLSGGNDISSFFASVGYQEKEGIVATDISSYKKFSVRLNSSHKITEKVTFGQTLGFSHEKSKGVGNTNSEFGGVLSSSINLDPTTPLIITDPAVANNTPYNDPNNPVVRDAFGNPYGISSIVGQEIVNPVAYIQTRLGNYNWSNNIVGNAYLQITPIKSLVFKTTIGTKLSNYGSEYFNPKFFLNSNNKPDRNSLNRETRNSFGWNLENTLTYTKQLENHNFVLLIGQGAYEEGIEKASNVRHQGIPVNNFADASFNFDIPPTSKTGNSFNGQPRRTSSLFSRLTYNYKEKYLFNATIRRDGSSVFGANNKYGIFPSISGGWIVSKENFWKGNSICNSLKFRASHGIVGKDAVEPFAYASNIIGGINYTLGNNNQVFTGNGPDRPANPDLKWESTTTTDLGLDASLFNNFNLVFTYFKKKSSDILQTREIPGFVGQLNNPLANVADMENTGVEFELGYNGKIGGVTLSANGNVTYLENKVTFLGDGKDFINDGTARFQSMGDITRTAVGQSYNSFYGFQTAGIFQTEDEVNNYLNSAGTPVQPNAKPGDFRWVDNNGDGKITDDDKTFLGSSIPKLNFGLTLNLEYKGFDFQAFFQGVTGNKIFQGLRRLDIANSNYQTEILNRWTGAGTSNDYPRLTDNDTNSNFGRPSDFYLQNGDYVRLKLMTLGYSLPSKSISSIGASKVRIYVTGQNILTFTKYTGFDPEIGGDISGIDKGIYPQARGLILGLNLQF
jgi:TonB-dependent starch-binding outer membrane protein SusC